MSGFPELEGKQMINLNLQTMDKGLLSKFIAFT